jgi:hypothetical protein
MAEDTQNPFYFDAELLSDHELIDKIKDILENVCGKLPILSSEPLDNALSNLDKDNKLPSILKLSTYLESWAINHNRKPACSRTTRSNPRKSQFLARG